MVDPRESARHPTRGLENLPELTDDKVMAALAMRLNDFYEVLSSQPGKVSLPLFTLQAGKEYGEVLGPNGETLGRVEKNACRD